MKREFLSISMVAASLAALPSHAEQGAWLARLRAISIQPSVSSSLGNIDVSDEVTPELDFSYFLSEKVALELILATQRHTVKVGGVDIGNVSHLPPTLTLQYHFMPKETFRPYVGVGLNYTRFYDVSLGGGTLTVDRNSWGGALQAGFDVGVSKNVFLNLDVKKIWIETDVTNSATGAMVSSLKINPVVIGAGIGIKF